MRDRQLDVHSLRRNSHHIAPRCRWKGKRPPVRVLLPVVFHDAWHFLFSTMTLWEACVFVEEVMTTRTRKGWEQERLLRLREEIINFTEQLRKRKGFTLDPMQHRPTRVNAKISFDHLPPWYMELHTFLFEDLETVAQVHEFIYELMQGGASFTGPEIVALRRRIARGGLEVVCAS